MEDNLTILLLTYNEAPNIGRTLERLVWAHDIVLVDSFSDDDTVDVAASFPQVRVFQRRFDSHGSQWNFGLNETGISSEWILALDADFVLSTELVNEIRSLKPPAETHGYRVDFDYCINGHRLRSGLLRAQLVLYRRSFAKYIQDGHTQRLVIEGPVETLNARILHDDRKPLTRWFESQQRYMALEAEKLFAADSSSLSSADRVRRLRVIAPLAVLVYCLFVRGGWWDGWPGFYYAGQRMLAELLLSLYLIERDFNAATEPRRIREQSTKGQTTVSSKFGVR